MQDVTYHLNFEAPSLAWDDGLYSVLGYDKSEPANTLEWWTEHIHPDDAMILNQAMDKLDDPAATEWTVSYRFRKADNTYVTVTDHATITRDSVGKASSLSGVISPKQSTS